MKGVSKGSIKNNEKGVNRTENPGENLYKNVSKFCQMTIFINFG